MKKIAIIIVALASFLLAGCSVDFNIDFSKYNYDDGDTYEAGNMEYSEEVNGIDISFISGHIDIVLHDDDTITLTETINSENTDYAVRSKVEAGTLKVKFYKSGVNKNSSNLNKHLVIAVPDKLYQEIEMDIVSTDVKCEARACEYNIDSVSGDITLNVDSNSTKVTLDTVSGDIDLKLAEDFGFKLEYETVSGDLSSKIVDKNNSVHIDSSRKFVIDTVSGDLAINIIEKI